ncbi:LysR family positive regulator for ilvC [Sinobacterium caligoides]|uniref:LysR family positive regulator for ilvC n=1 Tax=Sinobacterium caligoides TaxID=933926 RepID=A0A3N2DFV5_9GAMM|nr:HTH-type transcriptional activator IlvY [Sinobacterium caligoides]ROR98619.1 LysR family positive regulator for ilvC [Sinobacterium caligoides]
MDIKTLQLFLSLANTLNFAKTAERMNMSPSAVSRTVKRMEDGVDCVLFFRDNRRVELTRAGERYRLFAQQAVVNWQQLQIELGQQLTSPAGAVSLFCSVTASYVVLSRLLPILRQQHPGIEVHVHTGDQADAITRVLASEEEVGITVCPEQLPDDVEFLPLMRTPLKLIVPQKDKALTPSLVDIDGDTDWLAMPWVVSETGAARSQLDRWFSVAGRSPNIYSQVSGHEAIVSLVSLGFGVGLVPELVIDSSPMRSSVRVFSTGQQMEDLTIGVVVKRQRMKDPLLQSFWSSCQLLADEWAEAG